MTLKTEADFFFSFLVGPQRTLFYILCSSAVTSYFLPPLLLAHWPLFLQIPACGACKSQHGLFLPADASLDASNPSRSYCLILNTSGLHWRGVCCCTFKYQLKLGTTARALCHPRSWTDKTLRNH